MTGSPGPAPPPAAMEEAYVFPVSFAQERLWFLDQLDPGQSIYNMYDMVPWQGPLSVVALERALAALIDRHETLRTAFAVEDGEPVQVVELKVAPPLCVTDLTDLPPGLREAEAQRHALAEAAKPFDLGRPPLLRVHVFRMTESSHLLVLVVHHIVSDGWSMRVLFRELDLLYQGFAMGQEPALEPLSVQYADFAVWQREMLTGDQLERQLAYWRQRLEGAPLLLDLPTDRPRPAVASHRGALHNFSFDGGLTDAVHAFAAAESATPFMVLLAAFKLLLARYSGRRDIVVGTPIANRSRLEIEGLIGFFANTLVLRSQIDPAAGFGSLLGQVRDVTLSAYEHPDLPFERLVEAIRPERALNHNPLFQVMFVLNAFEPARRGEEGAQVDYRETGIGHAKFDLHFSVIEVAGRLRGIIEYATDLFDPETVARMAGHYQVLLAAALAAPDLPVGRLPLMGTEEWERTRAASASPSPADPSPPLVHERFARQARRAPDAVALVEGERSLDYAALDRRANALAHRLVAAGVGSDVPVGVHLPRSIEQIVALLGILKAGGCYVPLDPAYPRRRLADACADARIKVAIGEAEGLPFLVDLVLTLDTAEADAPPPATALPGSLAYILYTSGSTGRPKGVAMPHAPLANLVAWQVSTDGRAERVLQFTTLNFDVSAQEIFATLGAGATLVIAAEEERRDSAALLRRLAEDRIGRMFLPASALQALAVAADREDCPPLALREIVTAGEQLQLSPPLRRMIAAHGIACLRNQYGPTETHVASELSLTGPVDAWPDLPSIGSAIAGGRLYLLDEDGELVPDGLVGEIHIGGCLPARGYLGVPERTASNFLPDPFCGEPGSRMYRTGDLGRRRSDGGIDFLGRRDLQLKIRGVRVEPGEIEAVLHEAPGLREAAVVDGEDPAGGRRLVAFAVAPGSGVDALRRHCRSRLPEAMVPAMFVLVDSIPRTASGKVDRAGLAAAIPAAPAGGVGEMPRTPLEQALADIWREVLRCGPVATGDNFFDLGGHSLLATRVIARIRKRLGVAVPLRALFEGPTIAELADTIVDLEVARDVAGAGARPAVGATQEQEVQG